MLVSNTIDIEEKTDYDYRFEIFDCYYSQEQNVCSSFVLVEPYSPFGVSGFSKDEQIATKSQLFVK